MLDKALRRADPPSKVTYRPCVGETETVTKAQQWTEEPYNN
jgi:hypothetical protein